MKFAQYLDRNAVEEWRKAYINYKGLKKLIKRVEEHHRRRLQILASLGQASSDRISPIASKTSNSNKKQQESITELREKVRASQTGLAGGYGAIGRAEDLAAVPPPPHEIRTILLDGTRLKISPAVRDRVTSGGRNGTSTTTGRFAATNTEGGSSQPDIEAGQIGTSSSSTRPHEVQRPTSSPVDERDIVDEQDKTAPAADESNHQRSSPHSKSKSKSARSLFAGGGRKAKNQSTMKIEEYIAQYFDPSECIFFLALDSELERISDFYEDRLAEAQVKFDELIHQLRELAEHRRRFKEAEGNTAAGEERFKWRQNIPFVNDGGGAKAPKAVVGALAKERSGLKQDTHRRTHLDSHATAVNDKVDATSDDEGARRRSQALERMQQLAAEDGEQGQQASSDPHAPSTHHHHHHRSARDHTYDPERYKAARHKLKEAMAEFYRGLELIRSYKVLNKDGFGKILKKFDKTLETSSSIPYFRSRIEPSILVQSQRIDALLKSTEDAFTGFFEHGDRKRALDRLRMQGTTQNGLHTHHASASRTGFYLGVSLCAIIAGLVQLMEPRTQIEIPSWSALIRVYGALFLPVLFAVLFGLNLAAFAYGRINTAFIFEWDARHALDYHQYFETPSLLLLLLSIAFWVSFLNPFPSTIAPTTWPLVWLVVTLLFLLNPLPVFHPYSRAWFNRSMLRVLGSGFMVKGGVEFRDFFLGDELNSIAWSISSLWLFGCEYQRDWQLPECDANGTYWTAFLSCVPALLRLGQCLRRWKDSKFSARIHLLNATKYATAVPYYFTYLNWRKSGSETNGALVVFVFCACMYSIFSMTWDILMDWSFFHPNARYPLLRNELVFESAWPMYYFAIVSDIILRCNWIIYLLPGPASTLLRSFLVALLEVLRRFQWNFYRVGNEHQGNVDQYRALRDTPLPYHIPKTSSDDDEEQGRPNNSFGVKLQKWRRQWTQHDHFDFQRSSDDSDQEQVAHHEEEEREPRMGDGVYRAHTGIATATAAALDPLHAFTSKGESRSQSVVGKIQAFLVPDHGGYSARGTRLDEQSAAKGAMGRDYAPRAHEADADSDGEDGYTDEDDYDEEEEEEEAEHGGHGNGSGSDDEPRKEVQKHRDGSSGSGSGSGSGGYTGAPAASSSSSSSSPQAGSSTLPEPPRPIPSSSSATATTATAAMSGKDRDDAAARSLSKSWDRHK